MLSAKVVMSSDRIALDIQVNGQTVSAKDFGGKLLILNFWATWCQPCVQEAPSLDMLERQLGPKGLVVLGVSVDKDQKAYQEFLARFHVSYLTALESRIVGQRLIRVRVASTFLLRSTQPPIHEVDGCVVRQLRRIGKRIGQTVIHFR